MFYEHMVGRRPRGGIFSRWVYSKTRDAYGTPQNNLDRSLCKGNLTERTDSLGGFWLCLSKAFSFLVSAQKALGAAIGKDREMGTCHEPFNAWSLEFFCGMWGNLGRNVASVGVSLL